MSEIQIELGATGPRSITHNKIVIDGKDLANWARGFTLKARVGEIPQLILDLLVIDVTKVDAERVEVYLERETAALLERAGWTPPHGDPALLVTEKES